MLQELRTLSDYRELMRTAARRQIRTAVQASTLEFGPGPVRQDELEQILAAGEGSEDNLKAHVVRLAGFVFQGDEDAAIEWLMTPHPRLTQDEKKAEIPLDICGSVAGARRVERLLWELYYGLPG